jgi:hypothetical protein
MTCPKFGTVALLKTTSFRQLHIAQTNTQTPPRILGLTEVSIPLSQLANILVKLVGAEILKVK